MECEECREWEEHRYWEHGDAKGKAFFRVMLDDFSRSMRIPRKFADRLQGELSEFVSLKDPSGVTWRVGLAKNVDGAFLQSGWKDFAEAHCLMENDLLIFEYSGNSSFAVKVLEGSGCEKAHSSCLKSKQMLRRGRSRVLNGSPCCKVLVSSSSSSSGDDTILKERHCRPQKISMNQINASKPPIIKSRVKEEICINDESYDLPGDIGIVPGNTSKSTDARKATTDNTKSKFASLDDYENLDDQEIHMTGNVSLTSEEKRITYQLARLPRSGNPYFICIMRPSNVSRRILQLRIPTRFKPYLPSKGCPIALNVPGKRKKWHVNLFSYKYTAGFAGGWKRFVLDNGLLEGDVCLFELINNVEDNIEMRVRIRSPPAK